jgi:hypothetical protein
MTPPLLHLLREVLGHLVELLGAEQRHEVCVARELAQRAAYDPQHRLAHLRAFDEKRLLLRRAPVGFHDVLG